MTSLVVLYRGNSLSELELVSASADPVVTTAFSEIMKTVLDEESEPVNKSLNKNPLRLVTE